MKRLMILLVMMSLPLFFIGCGSGGGGGGSSSGGQTAFSTPEKVIDRVIQACEEDDGEKYASCFENEDSMAEVWAKLSPEGKAALLEAYRSAELIETYGFEGGGLIKEYTVHFHYKGHHVESGFMMRQQVDGTWKISN